jgi:hypothetical protein
MVGRMRNATAVVLLMMCVLTEGGPAFGQAARASQLMQRAFKLMSNADDAKLALRDAEILIASRQYDDAERLLHDIARRQQASRARGAQEAARHLFDAVEALRIERRRIAPPPRQPSPPMELPDPKKLFEKAAPLLRVAPDVPSGHEAIVVRLHEAIGSKPMLVSRAQARFVRSFSRGAAAPERYLENSEHARRWLSVPRNKRISIVAAGLDEERLRRVADDLWEQGFVVFFYKDCGACSSETVGAYMATAGEVLVSQSLNAADSVFVGVEITIAQRARAGQSVWIMYAPLELSASGIALGGSGYAAVTVISTDG